MALIEIIINRPYAGMAADARGRAQVVLTAATTCICIALGRTGSGMVASASSQPEAGHLHSPKTSSQLLAVAHVALCCMLP